MKIELIFGAVLFVIGLLIIISIILFVWWRKIKNIKDKAPDFNSNSDLQKINFDNDAIERRKLVLNGTERGYRNIEKETNGVGESEEEEIRRIRAEITRRERELSN